MNKIRKYPPIPSGDLWVFAYGSLMWRPDFEFIGAESGKIFGFRRDLCLRSVVHRGTARNPGIVFGLVTGGSCAGRVFRVAAAQKTDVLEYLWRREMVMKTYVPKLVRVYMKRGWKVGITFVVDPSHPQFVRNLSDPQIASIIDGSRGQSGHNRDYFLESLNKLEEMGVRVSRYNGIRALMQEGNGL